MITQNLRDEFLPVFPSFGMFYTRTMYIQTIHGDRFMFPSLPITFSSAFRAAFLNLSTTERGQVSLVLYVAGCWFIASANEVPIASALGILPPNVPWEAKSS